MWPFLLLNIAKFTLPSFSPYWGKVKVDVLEYCDVAGLVTPCQCQPCPWPACSPPSPPSWWPLPDSTARMSSSPLWRKTSLTLWRKCLSWCSPCWWGWWPSPSSGSISTARLSCCFSASSLSTSSSPSDWSTDTKALITEEDSQSGWQVSSTFSCHVGITGVTTYTSCLMSYTKCKTKVDTYIWGQSRNRRT